MAHKRLEFTGEYSTSIFPVNPLGSPSESFFHDSPPSLDIKTPPSSLPSTNVHGFLWTVQKDANNSFSLLGFISTSLAPVLLLM